MQNNFGLPLVYINQVHPSQIQQFVVREFKLNETPKIYKVHYQTGVEREPTPFA